MPDLGVNEARTAPDLGWQAQFALAEIASAGDRFGEAEALYRAVTAAAPGHIPAYMGVVRCARHRSDLAASFACLQAAIAANPTHVGLRLEGAADAMALRQLEDAVAMYLSVIELDPPNVPARLGLGHCARQRGDRLEALAMFGEAAKLAPLNPWPMAQAGTELRELGRLEEAEASYRQALTIAPGNPQVLLGLGHCARQRGDYRRAMVHVRAAIAVAPADAWAWLDLAIDLRETGALDEAEGAARQALLHAPNLAYGHIGLALCARKRGDHRGAAGILQDAILLLPKEPALHAERAADLRELGELEAADAECRAALALAPGNARALLGLAHSARKRGDREATVAAFAAAAAALPFNPSPRLELAAELRELWRLDDAALEYGKILNRFPGNVHASIGLGFCARSRGDRAAALALFEAAGRANPSEAAPWLEIALEQREAGDPDAAIATARDVLARHTAHLPAMMSIGVSNRYAGRHEAALAAFTAAHEAHPHRAEPLAEMAVSARFLGRQTDCDAWLAQALECDPRNVSATLKLAEQAMMAADFDAALEICREAVAAQPGQLPFQLCLVEALAAAGETAAALVNLEAMRQAHGALPVIATKRIVLLRQAGETYQALAEARAATAALPENFQFWLARFACEILVGSDADLENCLAGMQPCTEHQHAAIRRLHGNAAEAKWHLAAAISHYEAAADLNPLDGGLRLDLVRAKILTLDIAAARAHLRIFCEQAAPATRLQGRSLNISQSHFGQIINEYRMNRKLLADLAALQGQPPGPRAATLSAIVRSQPDNTAAAVSLMVALRQAGRLAPDARRPAPDALLPRLLTQFWDSPEPPADVTALMATWREKNPRIETTRFDDAAAQAFLRASLPPAVLAAYLRVREPAQKADIFRLAYLTVKGGIYADADDRCLRPLDDLLQGNPELMLYQEDQGTLGNNFIAARAGHPVLAHALFLAVKAISRGDTDNVWLSTGPGLLTRAFAVFLTRQGTDGVLPPGVFVLDRRELSRVIAIHCCTGYKKTERHWSNTSFGRRRDVLAAVRIR
jgi:tetratricopeptide (TPR) repeat protein